VKKMIKFEPQFDLLDIIIILIAGIVIGICLACFTTPSLIHPDYAGAYVQAAKNCIAAHDWNNTWCTTGIMK